MFGRMLSNTSSSETGALLSRGYNVANPITGEIISATANVWLNEILTDYITSIRQYIRFHVYPPAWKLRPHSKGVTDFFHKKIQSTCPEVRDFVDKNNRPFDLENPDLKDESLIGACAKNLAHVRILQSILQNMLQGFGQKRVLSASADAQNFYKNSDEIRKIFGSNVLVETSEKDLHPDSPQYSSVMDVIEDIEHPILSVPGKLDIAALRFIYFDQVELTKAAANRIKDSKNISCIEDGRCFLKVPAGANSDSQRQQKSILQTVQAEDLAQEDIKAYRVCGWDTTHPLCKGGDYGASPLEVVKNTIIQTDNYIMSMRNRHDSDEIPKWDFTFNNRLNDFYKRWIYHRDKLFKGRKETLLDYSFLRPDHRKEYKRIIEEEARRNPEFRAYYEIRQPVFNYFYKWAFMPVKHCVYKGFDDSYSAIALENIEKEIDYQEYPEDSREPFVSCKSPVVQAQARKNNRGSLVAEVGFFGRNRKYLLRPNEKDDIDENSAFIEGFFKIVAFKFLPREPDLMAKYYKSMQEYIFNGLDLNPYIDMTGDPDIPRDKDGYPNLHPVLSHKIDTEIKYFSDDNGDSSVYERRQFPMKIYIEALQNHYMDEESRRLLSTHFDYQSIALKRLNDYVDEVEKNPQLYEGISPFIVQAYKDYKLEDKEISFVEFLRQHPATLSRPDDSQLLIPFVDNEEESFMAQLFRRFNEYADCIQKSEHSSCEFIEDKQAFVESVLDSYCSIALFPDTLYGKLTRPCAKIK